MREAGIGRPHRCNLQQPARPGTGPTMQRYPSMASARGGGPGPRRSASPVPACAEPNATFYRLPSGFEADFLSDYPDADREEQTAVSKLALSILFLLPTGHALSHLPRRRHRWWYSPARLGVHPGSKTAPPLTSPSPAGDGSMAEPNGHPDLPGVPHNALEKQPMGLFRSRLVVCLEKNASAAVVEAMGRKDDVPAVQASTVSRWRHCCGGESPSQSTRCRFDRA